MKKILLLSLLLLISSCKSHAHDYRSAGIVLVSTLFCGTGLYLTFWDSKPSPAKSVSGGLLIGIGLLGILESSVVPPQWDECMKRNRFSGIL